jgi:hypothetical protein
MEAVLTDTRGESDYYYQPKNTFVSFKTCFIKGYKEIDLGLVPMNSWQNGVSSAVIAICEFSLWFHT